MKSVTTALSIALLSLACAPEPTEQQPLDYAASMQELKREAAAEVAHLLNSESFRSTLTDQLTANEHLRLRPVLEAQLDIGDAATQAQAARLLEIDERLRAERGLAAYTDSLLEVRVVWPEAGPSEIAWDAIPVAYLPSGEEETWTDVEAFTAAGRVVTLSASKRPAGPVLVAGIDGREDLRAGVAFLNDELTRRGLHHAANIGQTSRALSANSIQTSKLDYIRLNDDEESWISGRAEVYAIVSGVDPNADGASIAIVDMPYLDYDDTNYYPNQILIFWDSYRFAAANILLYERDDNTNYQQLVLTLISAVEAVLNFAAPEYALIAQILNQIVAAMPSHWFTNDDDYLDSFYTLEKGRTYTSYYGAARNARITLTPYTLAGN